MVKPLTCQRVIGATQSIWHMYLMLRRRASIQRKNSKLWYTHSIKVKYDTCHGSERVFVLGANLGKCYLCIPLSWVQHELRSSQWDVRASHHKWKEWTRGAILMLHASVSHKGQHGPSLLEVAEVVNLTKWVLHVQSSDWGGLWA